MAAQTMAIAMPEFSRKLAAARGSMMIFGDRGKGAEDRESAFSSNAFVPSPAGAWR